MKEEDIFQRYNEIADIFGKMFDPILEVVVHDTRKGKETIMTIVNGHISGREVGYPASSIAMRMASGEFPDRIINYTNDSPNGETMKSSNIAIRNTEGEIIGSLALNLQTSYLSGFGQFIERFIATTKPTFMAQKESFSYKTPKEEIKEAISEFYLDNGIHQHALTKTQRMKLIEHLYLKGEFNKRSAIQIVSEELRITRPTVYRYLETIKLKS